MGNTPTGENKDEKEVKKYDKLATTMSFGRKKRNRYTGGDAALSKIPDIQPQSKNRLRQLRLERAKDYLLMQREYAARQEAQLKARANGDDRLSRQRAAIEEMRGPALTVGTLEELVDDNHALVSSSVGLKYYVNILSFVDRDRLEPNCSVLLHAKALSVVGVLAGREDPAVSVMRVDKAPAESYADVGGLEAQVREVREAVELPLSHPELYDDMGIQPPKGVIFYGAPGTGKTLLAKAVARETSATFLHMVGSELVQKYLGDGPKLVRELFRAAEEHAPSIVFIDEIDAVGARRHSARSGGAREVQRTMLELLNQLDGFDARGEVKVIMATNRIETLDPALLRPGRIDRKIEFPLPDAATRRRIFAIHTARMTLGAGVDLAEFEAAKDDLSGADIKAICTEAGMAALRERRMTVSQEDFRKARLTALFRRKGAVPERLYV